MVIWASLLNSAVEYLKYSVYQSTAKERMMQSEDESRHTLIADNRVCQIC